MTQSAQLYRHYDSEGNLLYVGISLNAVNRLAQHNAAAWFSTISRVEVQTFPSRAQAAAAEIHAIRNESPRFNQTHTLRAMTPAVTMTPTQFRAALDRLGLSQVGAARLFGADERTARRWALGERDVPTTVAVLLRLMLVGKVSAEDVEAARR